MASSFLATAAAQMVWQSVASLRQTLSLTVSARAEARPNHRGHVGKSEIVGERRRRASAPAGRAAGQMGDGAIIVFVGVPSDRRVPDAAASAGTFA
jgi:hypothetical protein